MVYPPKTLMVGRCSRCGKRLYLYEDRYVCKKMGYVFCDVRQEASIQVSRRSYVA